MKNLPDEELFDQLGSRLRNYHEEPGELVWKNITAATHSQSRNGMAWVDHTALGISLAALLFFVILQPAGIKTDLNVTTKEQNSLSSEASADSSISEINGHNANAEETIPKNTSNNKSYSSKVVRISTTSNKKAKQAYAQMPLDELALGRKSMTENQETAQSEYRQQESYQQLTKMIVDSTRKVSEFVADSLANPMDEAIIPPKKMKRRLNFYIALSPSMNYRQVTPIQNDNIVITQLANEGVFTAQRFGIALETGWQVQISSSFELYLGLSYYQQNQTLTYRHSNTNGNAVVNTDNPMVFKLNVSEHRREVNYQMNNIGLQAGFLYQLKAGSLIQKVGAGLWYQYGLHQKSEGASYDNSQSGYLSYQLLYRNEYTFSNKLTMFVQPNFTQSIYTSESLNEPFKLKPYSVGVSIGIIYTLQRR